jgi:RNA polymerase sigma-70 factor (ECF subfamily)
MEAIQEETAETLARKHFRRVYAFCRSLLRSDADAEDAAQSVFLTVARRQEEIPRVARPVPWLLQIARLTCLNLRRERDRLAAGETEDPVEVGPPLGQDEDLDRLRGTMDRLPERYRTILALHFQQGLSHAESAEVLGLSRGAVRVLLHRAVARLRQEARKP